MRILVLGATGFIGRHLTKELAGGGHEVVGVTRSAAKGREVLGGDAEIVEGDIMRPGDWLGQVGRADAVVNLAGEPIMERRLSAARLQLLRDSRLVPTELIVEEIKKTERKPAAFICGSAIGYYGDRGDELVTEDTGPGGDWAAQLCRDWEGRANRAAEEGVRVVNLRTGFVLGPGAALGRMAAPFKFFLGGPIGSGRQFVSWIHLADHVGITSLALFNEAVAGPINVTSPTPVTNREFSRALGEVLNRPSWLPVPALSLRLLFGEAANILLEGQRVLPKKAQDAGYQWRFTDLKEALRDALARL